MRQGNHENAMNRPEGTEARLLRDPDEGTRMAAVAALRTVADPESTDVLIDALDDSDRIAWTAADALGRIRDPRAIVALSRTAQSHSHRWARRSAAEALAQIGGAEAVRALEETARNERNLFRRRRLRLLALRASASEP